VQGEAWAEKVAAEVAARLGVPAARVELAQRGGRRGSISLSLRPDGWELQHGSVLLAGLVPGHAPKSRDRRGHTLDNIRRVLAGVAAPQDWVVPAQVTAFDVFAGYLLLDALVANQDRHEENWAVLRPSPGRGPVRLAGSYDHGSSLGFNLTDQRRALVLGRDGVADWAGKGTAQRFERASEGRLTLVELASKALSLCSPAARARGRGRVAEVDAAFWEQVVAEVPQ
jgi:hypothetical protein